MVLRSSIILAGWILAVSAVALTGCAESHSGADGGAAPEILLEGVRFRLYRADALRADGTASAVTYERGSTQIHATALELTLRERQEPIRLNAHAVDGLVSGRSFLASGGVRAVRGADTAVTEVARLEPTPDGRGQVAGDRPVELTGPGYRLVGKGFDLDLASGEIAVRGGTRLVTGLPGGR
jgi:lipopolysaccharide export system protein LptC